MRQVSHVGWGVGPLEGCFSTIATEGEFLDSEDSAGASLGWSSFVLVNRERGLVADHTPVQR